VEADRGAGHIQIVKKLDSWATPSHDELCIKAVKTRLRNQHRRETFHFQKRLTAIDLEAA
jgi:hypothetical protein